MKCVIFLGDGMADEPIAELSGKTPLEVANHPNMDMIASRGVMGIATTVPDGMSPGSDVANLSMIGVDPKSCYTGRSPLEAVSIGVKLNEGDVTYRCNLVTLSDEADMSDKTMLDYSAGEITSAEAAELIKCMQDKFGSDKIEFHAGVSYRHCLVLRGGETGAELTPPHDISGKKVTGKLPKAQNAELLLEMMEYSQKVFPEHPVNKKRVAEGKNPALSVWFWGEGTKPALPDFKEKYGLDGAMISAVDLLHGIGISMGLKSIQVEGATGNFHTNFVGKGEAAVNALKNGSDFVYIHVEAPDECGHQGQLKEKIWSIEQIDSKIIAPVMEYLKNCGEDWAVMVGPDHPTPMSVRTHTRTPVPFAYCSSSDQIKTERRYCEVEAVKTGVVVDKAHKLLGMMLNK